MDSTLRAIRSIGAEFANRLYIPIAIISIIICICVMAGSMWLTTFSSWWWLLVGLLIIPISVVIGLLVIVKLVIRYVTPTQTSAQKRQTKVFVTKLQRFSETAQTPKFVLLFKVVRDIAAPKENGLIASISTDTTSLRHDFVALCKAFKQS